MNEVQIQEISKKIRESGVTLINDFLNTEQFELANSALEYIVKHGIKKDDMQGVFPVFLKSSIIKLLKFEFGKLKKSFLLKKIAKDLQFKQIAEKIFDHEAELHTLDSYYSKKSNEFVIPWHNDIGYHDSKFHGYFMEKDDFYAAAASTINLKKTKVGGRGIKFFIYMTDVESENGCMSLIPYSHHIVKVITSLMLEKKIKLESYWHLKDLRALVLKDPIKNLVRDKVGNEKLNIFLNSSEFTKQNANANANDTCEFDYKMKKGGAVIFDELVVHRGSAPNKHGRLVLRYHYHKKI